MKNVLNKIVVCFCILFLLSCNKQALTEEQLGSQDQYQNISLDLSVPVPYFYGQPEISKKYHFQLPEGCMIDAMIIHAALDVQQISVWSKIMLVYYFDTVSKQYGGHAFCLWVYPNGSNRVYWYDRNGTFASSSIESIFKIEPKSFAEMALKNHPYFKHKIVIAADYIEPANFKRVEAK